MGIQQTIVAMKASSVAAEAADRGTVTGGGVYDGSLMGIQQTIAAMKASSVAAEVADRGTVGRCARCSRLGKKEKGKKKIRV
jgi:hypothetical protein